MERITFAPRLARQQLIFISGSPVAQAGAVGECLAYGPLLYLVFHSCDGFRDWHGSQILVSRIDPAELHVDTVTEPDPHSWGWYRSLAAAIVNPYDLPHSTVGGESGEDGALVPNA